MSRRVGEKTMDRWCSYLKHHDASERAEHRGRVRVIALVILCAVLLGASGIILWEEVTGVFRFLSNLSISDAAEVIRSWGIFAPVLSIALMLLQSIIAPLPSFAIAAANGMVFGPYWGVLLSWTGGMVGAVAAFLIARYFRAKTADRLLANREAVEYVRKISGTYGPKFVFIARLIPFISFDLVSYAAGLSYMKLSTFTLATGAGMIPGSILYTVIGYELRRFEQYSWIVFLVLAAVFVVMFQVKRMRKR